MSAEGWLLTDPVKLQKVGKYRILSKIGHGAMGEVHLAEDPLLKRQVAIKTLSALHAVDDDQIQRFLREAQSAAALNHPNIITVFDFGDEQGVFYLVMELLDGSDLKDLLARRAIQDLPTQLDIMEQIADGLAFAHGHGVIHRDLKPANLRVSPSGRVKIMDFGLARMQTSEMTRTGTVLGTPNYMSPEQVRGERADTRSDVFSLGAVFYELLSGKKAFQAESLHGILFKVLEDEPEGLQAMPSLPPALGLIVDKSLQKDPERRYQDAGQLRAAIRGVRQAMAAGPSDATVVFPTAGRTAAAATVITGPAASAGGPASVGSAGSVSGATRLGGPMVTGATALDLARLPSPPSSGAPTLSGQAPTQVSYAEGAPPAKRRAVPALAAGAALLVLAVAGGLLLRHWPPQPSPSATPAPDTAREQEQILAEQLVSSQVELGKVDLENKDYAGAIRQAERALQIDPNNAAARALVQTAKGRLEELDGAATQARAAFARGDTDGASRALAKVMALDPRHPVAAELSAALNQHFRQQAEEARRSALQAREAAARVKAERSDGWSQGQRLTQEADGLLRDQQFAVATQKFLESRDAYEGARRAAEIAARTPTPRPTMVAANPGPPPVGPGLPPVTIPPPPVTQPQPQLPPVTLTPVRPAGPSQDAAIRKVIADYGRAIESKDLMLFREVKPNLTADEAKKVAESFKAFKSQQVAITVDSVLMDGADAATVRVSRQDTINGKPAQRVQQTFRLVQAGGAWKIQSIGQ